MPEKSFPILFIASLGLGDAVAASGLIRRLTEEVPHARFTVVANAVTAPLFRDVPGLEQIIRDEGDGPAPRLRLWLKLRGRRWGLILDLRNSGVAGWLRRRRRAVLHPAKTPIHRVAQAAKLLRLEDDPPAPFLFTSAETEAEAAERCGAVGLPIIAIAPGARWVGKAWPAERFASVAARLLSPGGPFPDGRLMVLGDSTDREAGRAVKLAVSRDRTITEPGQLDPLMAYACLKHARLAIGNDTAALGLAAAAGVPTLALYGPSDERVTAPWGPHVKVLRGPRPFEAFKTLDPALDQAVCHMLDLSVDTVTRAARELLAETEPEHA